jgi:putative MATE family efflux protein
MVDMIVVGHELGKVGLSAVSIGGDVSNFLTFIAMGFSNAGQVIISQYIGAGERHKIGRFVSTMFSALMVCAVVVSGICLWQRNPILGLMNTPSAAWEDALAYSSVCMLGMVFIYGYNIVSAVLRGMGDSKHPFLFVGLAAIMNVILDVVFVIGLDMRAMGAALATVISQGSSFLLCAAFMWFKRASFELDLQPVYFIRPDWAMLRRLVQLGIPMAIKNASIQFSKLFVNSWINSYSVEVSAFAGIANKINSISNLVSNSMNTAGSSMVGQNIGAKKYERVPKIMKTIFATTLSMAAIMSVAILSFPVPIFRLFGADESVLSVAMEYLPIAVLIFAGSAFRSPMNALINGSGNNGMNFATAMLDGIILRIGLSVLFGLGLNMGYLGFWLGDACAGFTPFVIGLVFYYSGKWRQPVKKRQI